MKIIRHTDKNYVKAVAGLDRFYEADPAIHATVEEVVAAIRKSGDKALFHYTEKFGGPKLTARTVAVSAKEIAAARAEVKGKQLAALKRSHTNVRDFARNSMRKDWSSKNRQGVQVGERFDAFQRVGIYVPGGTAPLVSTALMTVTLAKAVGVPEIVVTTPADLDRKVNAALLVALDIAGATEIYKVGGAQAIAALAYGTKSIKPTVKIYGPGNAYVVEAKRQVFGRVAVDLLPGPSEVIILADSTANPAWIAADILAQAEHGARSLVGLVTNSARLITKVGAEIERQFESLSRKDHLRPVLDDSTFLVQTKSLNDAVEIVNNFAPEHLSISAKNEDALARDIRTAGAIFLGGLSPVAGGDFLAGPSHELPTGGAGKSFPGLTVDQFQRRTSIVRFTKESLAKSAPTIEAFGDIEGLDAHGRSATIRLK